MRIRAFVLYGLLFAVAAAVAIAAGDHGTDDKRSSIESTGSHGLRALYLYLEESGRSASALDSFDSGALSPKATLVIAAPTAREITADEVKRLKAFVEGGGTLVYLAPRALESQPEMKDWLELEEGPWLSGESATSPDARAETWIPAGPLAGVHALVTARDKGLTTANPEAIPVVGQGDAPVLWRRAMGKGEVWLAAGSDLAANSRLDQGDNLAFWDHLAQRGPMLFDELHQVTAARPPMSHAALALLGQFLLMGLLFAWARGARLGPPRMPPQVRHRASREYLTAFAGLMRRARVEGELAEAMHQRLRKRLHERMAIGLSLSDEEAAQALEGVSEISAQELLGVVRALRDASRETLTPAAFLELSRRCAELEARIEGRRAARVTARVA